MRYEVLLSAMVAWGGRGGLVSRGALLALCHSDFTSWRVEAGEKGNGLCWYNSHSSSEMRRRKSQLQFS